MKRRLLWIFPILAIVIVGAYVLLTDRPGAKATFTSSSGELIDMQLETLDRKGMVNTADLKGKPLVINFWASWCIPCREEFGELKKANDSLSDVKVVGILTQDNASDALRFVKEQEADWLMMYDRGNRFSTAYDVLALPQTIFVDADGSVVKRAYGPITEADILEVFEK